MKKVLFIISFFCLFSILGCSKKKSDNNNQVQNESEINQVQVTEEVPVAETFEEDTEDRVTDKQEETIIIRDEDFDFNANFDEALKASKESSGAEQQNKNADAKDQEQKEILPPGPVSNLQGTFNWKKNHIDLTWDEPEDTEEYKITSVEIRNDKSKDVVIIPKGIKKYSFTPKDKDDHKYIVTTCDSRGLKGKNVGCIVTEPYLFTSFTAPIVANTGKGKTVTANIEGISFDKYGIEEKDFGLFCPSNSYITNNSKVKRIDSNTLSATITIPKKSGNYAIVVNCGDVKFTGYFTVKDYSLWQVGKVMYRHRKPESVIAGYDSLGYPFGIALKEQGSLKWANEGSFGYNNCFNSIVSEPDVIGIDSAEKASFTGDIDGVDNIEEVCREDKDCLNEDGSVNMTYLKRTYPAFHYALSYGKNWFVPSISELSQIYHNREKLNITLDEIGGKQLKSDFYWSSTQNDYSDYNACAVKFVNGAIYKYYKKGNAVSVRCIHMYK